MCLNLDNLQTRHKPSKHFFYIWGNFLQHFSETCHLHYKKRQMCKHDVSITIGRMFPNSIFSFSYHQNSIWEFENCMIPYDLWCDATKVTFFVWLHYTFGFPSFRICTKAYFSFRENMYRYVNVYVFFFPVKIYLSKFLFLPGTIFRQHITKFT